MHSDVMPWSQMLLRLGIAFLLGALIGLERERHQRPAGLRTHILVALASALFSMTGVMASGSSGDPARIAAQVVTGIGFLGAGTIMRHGSVVRGLTTAASLWMAAALGVAAGFGWYSGAAAAALIAFVALTVMKYIEEAIPRLDSSLQLLLVSKPGHDSTFHALEQLRDLGIKIVRIQFGEESAAEGLHAILSLDLPDKMNPDVAIRTLTDLDDVEGVYPAH